MCLGGKIGMSSVFVFSFWLDWPSQQVNPNSMPMKGFLKRIFNRPASILDEAHNRKAGNLV